MKNELFIHTNNILFFVAIWFIVLSGHPWTWLHSSIGQSTHMPPHSAPNDLGGHVELQIGPKYPGLHTAKSKFYSLIDFCISNST